MGGRLGQGAEQDVQALVGADDAEEEQAGRGGGVGRDGSGRRVRGGGYLGPFGALGLRRIAGRWGGMVTVRTVAPGASSRAWAAWAAEWVITVSARLSRARVRATSPGRRSCGRTLWQMTAVRGGAAGPGGS